MAQAQGKSLAKPALPPQFPVRDTRIGPLKQWPYPLHPAIV